MRRMFAFAAALVLLAALVPMASANEPDRGGWHTTHVSCAAVDAGTLYAWLQASADPIGDSWADLTVYDSSSGTWELIATRPAADPAVVGADETSLTATIPLVDGAGVPAGVANLAAVLVPDGDPQLSGYRWHQGNLTGRFAGVHQPYIVGGSLVVTGATFDLAGHCTGWLDAGDWFNANPDARVSRQAHHDSECVVSDGASTALVGIGITDNVVGIGFGVRSGPALPLAGSAAIDLVNGSGAAPLFLYDSTTGEIIDTPGYVSISVARSGDRYSYTQKSATEAWTYTGELLDLQGEIVIEGGPTFSLDDCFGFDATVKQVDTAPTGPTAGGPVPVNDLPWRATELRPSKLAVAMTRGAALEWEVPLPCEYDEAGNLIAATQHTVWYKVRGTGGILTVDTAGSDFDTAVAAYTRDVTGTLVDVPGACNEDVELAPFGVSWQAKITFPTEAGTWYYVQIGGWPYWETSFGNLKVTLR